MFKQRVRGLTLKRRIEKAVYTPHADNGKERFVEDFPVALKCEFCGTYGHGPRKHMQEAMREHLKQCPAKRSRANAAEFRTQILYPKV